MPLTISDRRSSRCARPTAGDLIQSRCSIVKPASHVLIPLLAPLIISDVAACVICLDPQGSLLDQMQTSRDVVVARCVDSTSGEYQIVRSIRGYRGRRGTSVRGCRESAIPFDPTKRILRWHDIGQFWMDVGPADEEFLAFAEQMKLRYSSTSADSLSLEEQVNRLVAFIPFLEHSNPLIAEAAINRLAGAPYQTLRYLDAYWTPAALISRLDQLAEESADVAERRSLYVKLLGVCGRSTDLPVANSWIQSRLDNAKAEELEALLTASLELRGDSEIDHIATEYLFDPGRSLTEIAATISALSTHANCDGVVSQIRVQQAFRTIVSNRTPLMELVLADLQKWKDESLIPVLYEIRQTNAQPWNHQLIDAYLAAVAPRDHSTAAALVPDD